MNALRYWIRLIAIVGVCTQLPIFVPQAYAAPPAVVDVTPHPGDWIVGPDPLDEVTIIFDSPITVPSSGVIARTLNGGEVSVSVTPADPPVAITLSFPAVSADILTLVIDHSFVNDSGEALDGEVDDPPNPDLTNGTGDGKPGGPAVFQFTILQGDANRDGTTVGLDDAFFVAGALNTCVGHGEYDPWADLDDSGCVDDLDIQIVQSGAGKSLPLTDLVAPEVDSVFPAPPGPLPFVDDVLTLIFDEPIDASTVMLSSVYGVGADGSLLSASAMPTMAGDRTFLFLFESPGCLQNYTFKVSNAIADVSGELALPASFDYEGADEDPPVLVCPETLFINGTDPLGIPAGDVAASADIQAFLDSLQAQDACTDVTVTSSLDVPVDLPLGVTTVTFAAEDEIGNAAACDAALIVVPAVPLACWDLNENGVGDTEEDTNADGEFDALDCQGPQGATGATGPRGGEGETGISCWDLNENGEPDDDEDTNGDGVVDVADCAGASGTDGETGAIGPEGPPGSEGPPGTEGPAGQDAEPPAPQPEPDDTSTQRGPCGALGMITMPFTFLGLCTTRVVRRRRR